MSTQASPPQPGDQTGPSPCSASGSVYCSAVGMWSPRVAGDHARHTAAGRAHASDPIPIRRQHRRRRARRRWAAPARGGLDGRAAAAPVGRDPGVGRAAGGAGYRRLGRTAADRRTHRGVGQWRHLPALAGRPDRGDTQRTVYELVYDAPRPQLFGKAPAWRVGTDTEPIAIRPDSELDVPEPELAVLANAEAAVVGYLVCNHVSSRSIEGTNPLDLPQAKCYAGSTALSALVRPAWEVDAGKAGHHVVDHPGRRRGVHRHHRYRPDAPHPGRAARLPVPLREPPGRRGPVHSAPASSRASSSASARVTWSPSRSTRSPPGEPGRGGQGGAGLPDRPDPPRGRLRAARIPTELTERGRSGFGSARAEATEAALVPHPPVAVDQQPQQHQPGQDQAGPGRPAAQRQRLDQAPHHARGDQGDPDEDRAGQPQR